MHAQNLNHPLSAEYLLFQATKLMPGNSGLKGLSIQAVQSALRKHGQPHEDEWPYQMIESAPSLPPSVTTIWRADLALDPLQQASVIESQIKSGCPVILGIQLTSEFFDVQNTSYRIPSGGSGFGRHAVIAIGLGTDSGPSGDKFLLVRNSWGKRWALSGHAWLPMQYLADKLICFGTIVP